MASVEQIMEALAAQVVTDLDSLVDNLQVDPKLNMNPSPPCIDMFPGDPFVERLAMGNKWTYYFTVRLRVSASDHEGQQSLMLSLMDPAAATSLTASLEGTYSISGTTYDVSVEEGPSPFGIFNDPGSVENRTWGSLWRVRVVG